MFKDQRFQTEDGDKEKIQGVGAGRRQAELRVRVRSEGRRKGNKMGTVINIYTHIYF